LIVFNVQLTIFEGAITA